MKIFILTLLIFASVSAIYGQKCGGSYRQILIEFEQGAIIPDKIPNELFYVAPKVKSTYEMGDDVLAEFLSVFLYDDAKAKTGNFWKENFIEVPRERAENYLKNYDLKDFKPIYESVYWDHQLSQLKGNFENGELTLETREMDRTPFLMKISVDGFADSYLLNNFLGGCFSGREADKIKLKR
ncbi:MAG TPA: hypothetical protein PKE69_14190 [Pyrinomonadaceae bacterium]|nr:hypothetical protein [Pyrinomonadaceae bacterium]